MRPIVRKRLLLFGGIGVFFAALYPITIQPYFNSEEWKRIQRVTRKDIDQESVQPGGMKVWSDPFGPKQPKK